MTESELFALARRWLAAWNTRDFEALLALYAEDARHTSPKLRASRPDSGGFAVGKNEVRAWFADAFARLPQLQYAEQRLTAGSDRVFMEYLRQVPGEPELPVAEVLECSNGRIVASRVYHG